MVMTAVLLLGMIRRQVYGPGRVDFESTLVLVPYAGSVVLIFV